MNKLYKADCFDILPQIEDESIDLVLCDPPYATTKNKWDQPLNWDLIWENLKRICKTNSAIVLFSQFPFSSHLISSNLEGYKHYWVWDKKLAGNFAVSKYMPLSVSEIVLIFSKDGSKVNYYPQMRKGKARIKGVTTNKAAGQGFGGVKPVSNFSDEYHPTNILEYSIASQRSKSVHPSQKPVALLEYLIKTYSLEGQTVLDFTMGSGSTGVACKNLNRNFIGIEKEQNYFEIAKKRIEDTEEPEIEKVLSVEELFGIKTNE